MAAQLDESVTALFQVNGKGWNSSLLIKKEKLSEYECYSCGEICRDAVELGCDHDDNEINTYCQKCLADILNDNNNKCPINQSHDNPHIQSNRTVRRNVLKLCVYCPNSFEYKNKNKGVYNELRDTLQENEGSWDNKQNDDDKKSGCHWNGTLNELINNHSKQCKEISADLHQKLIQNVNKKINDITLYINKMKTDNTDSIKTIQQSITELQNMIKTINITLSSQQNQIVELKQSLKQKENEINNNKQQIENWRQKHDVAINKLEAKLNKIQQELDQTDESKSKEEQLSGPIQYKGKFLRKNAGKGFKIISSNKIEQHTTTNASCSTAKLDAILPSYDPNSNCIVYWKIQFLADKKEGKLASQRYFVGVISDTVNDLNTCPYEGMKKAFGVLGGNGNVTKGEGRLDDASFSKLIKHKEVIQIEYHVSKSIIEFKIKDKDMGQIKLPTTKHWYPAVSFETCGGWQGITCNVIM